MIALETVLTALVPYLPLDSGARPPPEVRALVAEYLRSERSVGTTCPELAGRLGISVPTVKRWLQAERMAPEGAPLVRVEFQGTEPTLPTRSLVLISPTGFRVEGADAAQIATILAQLG